MAKPLLRIQAIAPVFVISDLHLSESNTTLTALFTHFCQQLAPQAKTLVILGDFFEYWVGDDATDAYQQDIANQLKSVQAQGTNIYLMGGNRDFLLGQQYCDRFHGQHLSDPCLLQLEELTILLSHGDQLCTQDKAYQRYRRFVHQPLFQSAFLALPKSLRQALARRLRHHSRQKKRTPFLPQDIELSSWQAWQKQYPVPLFIHGHTHQASIHYLPEQTRIVLGDWTDHISYLSLTSEKILLRRESFK